MQTLLDTTSPAGKIHRFSEITVTFEPNLAIRIFFEIKNAVNLCYIVIFETGRGISNLNSIARTQTVTKLKNSNGDKT